MTVVVWMAWRLLQLRRGTPQIVYIWLAIIVSALLFGAGHLPAPAAQVGELTSDLAVLIVGASTVFGYLFWRFGLEAAIIAHAFAHVVSGAVSIVVA